MDVKGLNTLINGLRKNRVNKILHFSILHLTVLFYIDTENVTCWRLLFCTRGNTIFSQYIADKYYSDICVSFHIFHTYLYHLN